MLAGQCLMFLNGDKCVRGSAAIGIVAELCSDLYQHQPDYVHADNIVIHVSQSLIELGGLDSKAQRMAVAAGIKACRCKSS